MLSKFELKAEKEEKVNDRSYQSEGDAQVNTEPQKNYIQDYRDVPLETRATVVGRRAEELAIFVSHFAPQVNLRKDLVEKLTRMQKDAKESENEILSKWMEMAASVEKRFLSKFKLDIFEIDSY